MDVSFTSFTHCLYKYARSDKSLSSSHIKHSLGGLHLVCFEMNKETKKEAFLRQGVGRTKTNANSID